MLNVARSAFTLIRARWRWARGRCPRCNRNLYAQFPYYMANDPHCPVCEGESQTDLRMWHEYRTLGTAQRSTVAVAVRREDTL
jgi:hypothetical protein